MTAQNWIIVVVGWLIGSFLYGFVKGLFDRRPACSHCGRKQRGMLSVEYGHSTPEWSVRTEFRLCNQHIDQMKPRMAALDDLANRMSIRTDGDDE